MVKRSYNTIFAFEERINFVAVIIQSMHYVQEMEIGKAFCYLAFQQRLIH
jgi:hypothetical protein